MIISDPVFDVVLFVHRGWQEPTEANAWFSCVFFRPNKNYSVIFGTFFPPTTLGFGFLRRFSRLSASLRGLSLHCVPWLDLVSGSATGHLLCRCAVSVRTGPFRLVSTPHVGTLSHRVLWILIIKSNEGNKLMLQDLKILLISIY